MTAPNVPDAQCLDGFRVSNPDFVDETALATIWKVQLANGHPAALKIYHGSDMRNEAAGFDLMRRWDGRGAARLFARNENAAVMEWLDGPSIGDLTRAHEDELATDLLVDVANRLHEAPIQVPAGLPDLTDWFGGLFALEFHQTCPESARNNMTKAQRLADSLLATQHDVMPLHGDLHHDNVRMGARGYCAFDAKGVLGERTYELANAFRNPKGADEIVRSPLRIQALAKTWSDRFKVDRSRLLNWAAAKCALSIAWRAKGLLVEDRELDLLSILLDCAAAD